MRSPDFISPPGIRDRNRKSLFEVHRLLSVCRFVADRLIRSLGSRFRDVPSFLGELLGRQAFFLELFGRRTRSCLGDMPTPPENILARLFDLMFELVGRFPHQLVFATRRWEEHTGDQPQTEESGPYRHR